MENCATPEAKNKFIIILKIALNFIHIKISSRIYRFTISIRVKCAEINRLTLSNQSCNEEIDKHAQRESSGIESLKARTFLDQSRTMSKFAVVQKSIRSLGWVKSHLHHS